MKSSSTGIVRKLSLSVLILSVVSVLCWSGRGLADSPWAPPVAQPSTLVASPNSIHGAAAEQVDNGIFYGQYIRSYVIETPAFHGIAPSLALQYTSTGQNGIVGVGWALQGFSTIHRSLPDRTIGKEVFRLDGAELVACPAGTTSPGCVTGGTHAAKIENYQRMKYDSASETWTVWRKDGTRTEYSPVVRSDGDVVITWGASRVVDANNNVVNYEWQQEQGTYNRTAVPKAVIYNPVYPTRVEFTYEARSDVLSVYGPSGIGQIGGRLAAVVVTVAGENLRGYQLNYTQSTSTDRSLLTEVVEYGRGVRLNGTRLDGESRPRPAHFAYTAASRDGRWRQSSGPTLPWQARLTYELWNWDAGTRILDLDGNGLPDVLQSAARPHESVSTAWLNNGAGFVEGSSYARITSGKAIPFLIDKVSGAMTGYRLADLNGDGLMDLVNAVSMLLSDDQKYWHDAYLNTGSGWRAAPSYSLPNDVSLNLYAVNLYVVSIDVGDLVDINGDQRADYVDIHHGTVLLNQPDGDGVRWVSTPSYLRNVNSAHIAEVYGNVTPRFADLNGDGLNDMLWSERNDFLKPGGKYYESDDWMFDDAVAAWINTGNGFRAAPEFLPEPHFLYKYTKTHNTGTRLTDLNGDGMADILQVHRGEYGDGKDAWITNRKAWLSTGSGWKRDDSWAQTIPYFSYDSYPIGDTGTVIVDINGDGAPDVAQNYRGTIDRSDSYMTSEGVWLNTSAQADLLNNFVAREGWEERIDYAPSTRWPNSKIPFVLPTVTRVSRSSMPGDFVVDAWSTHDYTYEGGLFDGVDRRFLGFRYVKEILPAVTTSTGESGGRPIREIRFRQDYGSLSKPFAIWRTGSDGRKLHYEARYFVTNGRTIPYTSLQYSERLYDFSGLAPNASPAGAVITAVTRSFDAYANVISELDYGHTSRSGDEKYSIFLFYPNVTKYIVGKNNGYRIFSGSDESSPLIGHLNLARDVAGNPINELRRNNEGWVVRRWSYDASGNVIAEIDALKRTTNYIRQDGYYVSEVRDPMYDSDPRHRVTQEWDPVCGKITSATDENGLTTSITYDAFCRVIKAELPSSEIREFAYVDRGWAQPVVRTTRSMGGSVVSWQEEYFDGYGRLLQTKRPAPGGDTIVEGWRRFDGTDAVVLEARPHVDHGWAALFTAPDEATRNTYDELGRIVSVRYADNSQRSWEYGQLSQIEQDEMGNREKRVMDARGRVVESAQYIDGAWHSVYFTYDVLGQLLTVQDEDGNITRHSYDLLGRHVSVDHPDTGRRDFTYDAAGQLVQTMDARAVSTRTTYDALGRSVLRVSAATTADEPQILETNAWQYDEDRDGYFNVGRVTQEIDGHGERRIDYDHGGHVVRTQRTVNGSTYTTGWSYDALGRLRFVTYPDGDTLASDAAPFVYDDAGRLAQIPGVISSIQYAPDGRVLVRTDASGGQINYSYTSERGFLQHISASYGGNALQTFDISRYANGFVRKVDGSNPAHDWLYSYDGAGRLVSATGLGAKRTYQYTPMGNIVYNGDTGRTYIYPDKGSVRPHGATHVGDDALAYDANGNVVTLGSHTMTWDGSNRLLAYDATLFAYDANGQRLMKTEGEVPADNGNGNIVDSISGTGFSVTPMPSPVRIPVPSIEPSGGRIRNPAAPHIEPTKTRDAPVVADVPVTTVYLDAGVEVTNGVFTKYIKAAGSLVAKRVDQQTSYFVTDHLGSITGVMDGTGQLTAQSFEPFGQWLQIAANERHGFTGERRDQSGLIYLQSRYYHPDLGRFTSADRYFADHPMAALTSPIEAVNAYAYAANNPVNRTDPTGEAASDAIAGFSIGVFNGIGMMLSSFNASSSYDNPMARAEFLPQPGVWADIAKADQDFRSGVEVGKIVGSFATIYAARPSGRAGTVVESSTISEAEVTVAYPPNRGFEFSGRATLIPGTRVDRYGKPTGSFVSPEGTPFSQRSLPASAQSKSYNVYQVAKPFEVDAGPAAPWFGQQGKGMQYELPTSVQNLMNDGFLTKAN